jgi:hypothetical protein
LLQFGKIFLRKMEIVAAEMATNVTNPKEWRDNLRSEMIELHLVFEEIRI